jgi:nitrite reductase/ring-hydroxylating ferredoxin subunit
MRAKEPIGVRWIEQGTSARIIELSCTLFRHQGEVFALDETCPHRGGPLHDGVVDRGVVLCPWHQWQFDLKTGCSPVNPLSRVRVYPVRLEGTDVWLDTD